MDITFKIKVIGSIMVAIAFIFLLFSMVNPSTIAGPVVEQQIALVLVAAVTMAVGMLIFKRGD